MVAETSEGILEQPKVLMNVGHGILQFDFDVLVGEFGLCQKPLQLLAELPEPLLTLLNRNDT